jgi:hypothetical protein
MKNLKKKKKNLKKRLEIEPATSRLVAQFLSLSLLVDKQKLQSHILNLYPVSKMSVMNAGTAAQKDFNYNRLLHSSLRNRN